MKKFFPLLFTLPLASCVTTHASNDLTALVDSQYDAYQKKDLEKFMSFFAEDAKICMISPGEKCFSGAKEIRARFEKVFPAVDTIKVDISKRITDSNYVLDWENVVVSKDGKDTRFSGISVYRVEGGKIASLYIFSLTGAKK